mgnify:CR=1 FL=1
MSDDDQTGPQPEHPEACLGVKARSSEREPAGGLHQSQRS